MYIRIGNNVRYNINISTLDVNSVSDIVYAKGKFIPVDVDNRKGQPHHCVPQFYDSEYTIHDCCTCNYNALPTDTCAECERVHDHGFRVYEDYSLPVRANEDGSLIVLLFPGTTLKHLGRYKIELEYRLKGSIQVKTVDYGIQFELIYNNSSVTQDVNVWADDVTPNPNIYVTCDTTDYTKRQSLITPILLAADKYAYNDVHKNGFLVTIWEYGQHVTVLSPMDNLEFYYNRFIFPVTKIKYSNMYLYTSAYTYPEQTIPLTVSVNENALYDSIIDYSSQTTNPDPGPDVDPDPDIDPDVDPEVDTDDVVSGNLLVSSSIISNGVFYTDGTITNYTLIL